MSASPPCPDCGWRPDTELRTTQAGRREALWPTEGPRAVWWMQAFVICGEGDWYGRLIRLRDDQKLSLYRWYEWCAGCGHWRKSQWVRSEATGGGKTTFMGGVEVLELGGPPEIVPVSPSIVSAANSWDQANKLFGAAAVMCGGQGRKVAESPLREFFEVYDSKIIRSDGRPGEIKRVAAVAATSEGGLESLLVCDEVHEWGDVGSGRARVHVVIGKSTKKRRLHCEIPQDGGGIREIERGSGRIIDISTAGFDVDHSLFGRIYKQGKRVEHDPAVDPRMLFDCFEADAALNLEDPADRRLAVRQASPAAGVLWDVEERVREWDKPELEHHEWTRYYANRWVDVGEDSWLADHPAAWAACQGEWELNGDEQVVLAVDMSLKHDSTAVVECTLLDDGRTAVTARIWNPGDGKVDHLAVFKYITERAEVLGDQLLGLVYDPRYFELAARQLEDDTDIAVIEFDQWTIMAQAVGETFEQIIKGRLVQDGDPDFGRHVRSAVKKQQERGFTLSKSKSRWKIDAAVAMCMGTWTLTQQTDLEGTFW
jgi:phage terminase large subunit-like protein